MKEMILMIVSDLVADFCYYDRKECEVLTESQLDESIATGEITIDEIVDRFRSELVNVYSDQP